MVHQVQSEEEFTSIVQSGTVVVDFTATWCGNSYYYYFINK
jgi:thiol-disulfide isomerase/thioredoxin